MQALKSGKTKSLYPGPEPNTLRMVFRDEVTAQDGKRREEVPGKGTLNAQISACVFGVLEEHRIATHFLRAEDERTLIVRALEMFPLEVVVRNLVAGSMARRLGLQEGEPLAPPVVEWYLKDDERGDPWLNEDHIVALRLAERPMVEWMRDTALQVNEILSPFFAERGLQLVDFKLEFGVDSAGQLRVGDEFSPDTCRLWDEKTRQPLDKDRFRRQLGDLLEGYREVLARLR